MDVEQRERLVEGIESMPPGPALATLLAAVDPGALSAYDAVRFVVAQRRQLCHEQARFAVAARSASEAEQELRGVGAAARLDDRFAGDELRAALSASRWKVGQWLRLADVVSTHPDLERAWLDGAVDEDRVRSFSEALAALSHEHAAAVVEVVLPEAPGLTLRALEQRLAEVAVGLDPEWAETTYRRRVAQRRVRARRTDGGTLTLSGLDLPLDEAALSVAHISSLAARVQAWGHPGRVDTVRADVYLALLSGRFAGRDPEDVAAMLAAEGRARADADADASAGLDEATATAPRREPLDASAAPPAQPDDDGARGDDTACDGEAPDTDTECRAAPSVAAPDAAGPGSEERRRAQSRGRTLPRQARIELRVGLGTVLGADDRPGRLPGYGVVHAGLARDLARQHARGEWRVVVTDDEGHVTAVLLPRRRPRDYPTTPVVGAARGVVELHVRDRDLDAVDPLVHPDWAALLTELRTQRWRWREHPPDDAHGADPDRRFPSAALRRWTQSRDRACAYPPCGASALDVEIDHTRPDAHGGQTRAGNLGALCTHDHDLREQPGWTLTQPRPGHFRWRSPSGHTYDQPPRAAIPDVPGPRRFVEPSSSAPAQYADDGPVWENDPYPDPPIAGGVPAPRPPPDAPPPF